MNDNFEDEVNNVALVDPLAVDLIKIQKRDKKLVAPDDVEIEGATRVLAGELLNDAHGVLQGGDIKDKEYAVKVLAQVVKMSQGKMNIKLKASAEKRENANFMIDLLDRAAAGTLSEQDIADMEGMVKTNEQSNTAQVT